jgi:hypothetical protein
VEVSVEGEGLHNNCKIIFVCVSIITHLKQTGRSYYLRTSGPKNSTTAETYFKLQCTVIYYLLLVPML